MSDNVKAFPRPQHSMVHSATGKVVILKASKYFDKEAAAFGRIPLASGHLRNTLGIEKPPETTKDIMQWVDVVSAKLREHRIVVGGACIRLDQTYTSLIASVVFTFTDYPSYISHQPQRKYQARFMPESSNLRTLRAELHATRKRLATSAATMTKE